MKVEQIICELQPYIQYPPVNPKKLYEQSCSNDGPTVDYWAKIWVEQITANHATHGPFIDKSVGKLFNSKKNLPAIIAGSGPSLAKNGLQLKNRSNALLLSCLHNFHFFEDNDIEVDYYVTLDAGPITLKEVSEGGEHPHDWYLERTNKPLIAFIGTHPSLLAAWRGPIYFYSCAIPSLEVTQQIDAVEPFSLYCATGGNVLGATTYIAKAIFGCSTLAFLGTDFCFSYMDKFHGWDSDYDAEIGQCMRVPDIYGNKVKTWPSYYNFKCWFDWLTTRVPGIYINCSEGGTFGAYDQGNIMSVRQMELSEFIGMLDIGEHIREQIEHPDTADKKILW